MSSGYLKNILIIMGISGTSFLLLDTVIRFSFPEYTIIYQYDKKYLHSLIPNSEKGFVKINSNGFRETELYPYIIIYGDSFIEAEWTEQNKTVPSLLAKSTQRTVFNAGVVGYGIDQIYDKMMIEIPLYKPKIVVISVFTGNDFGDFVRDAGGVSKTFRFKLAIARILPSLNAFFIQSSKLKEFIALYPNYTFPNNAIILNQRDCNKFGQVNNLFGDRYDVDMNYYPTSVCTKLKILLMNETIKDIIELSRKSNISLIFLIIPAKYDVDNSNVPLKMAYPKLIEGMIGNITFINLGYYLNESHYQKTNDHWTDESQEIASKLLFKSIEVIEK